jgi:hypothetical protein
MVDDSGEIVNQQAPAEAAPVVSSEPLQGVRVNDEERDALSIISQELRVLRHAGPLA